MKTETISRTYNNQELEFNTRRADYSEGEDAQAIAILMAAYSGDEMGGGERLPESVCCNIASGLNNFGQAFTVLAYAEDEFIGIANCIKSFSTFNCKPLINVHDFYVRPAWRGLGVARALLDRVEEISIDQGCCKLTLEVLSGNIPAKKLYEKVGFKPYSLSDGAGEALFWEKLI